jgi:two-component system KDP operon response regulator KdpE
MNQKAEKIKPVLLIEDDPLTIEMIKLCLEIHRPDIGLTIVREGSKGIDLVRNEFFGVLMLDLGLPDIDGMIVLEEIRRFSPIPILIISARSSPDTISRGLELGASDYISKPFDFRLLLDRLERLMRPSPLFKRIIQFPGLKMDLGSCKISRNDQTVQLNTEECKLLTCLAGCEGKIVTMNTLAREIWQEEKVNLVLLESAVSGLREKLGDNQPQPKMIVSEHGAGYRLLLPSGIAY